MLPETWHTSRLEVTDVRAADADSVLQCLAESADIAVLDPTFGPAPRDEIEELIAKSHAFSGSKVRSFQMQMIRRLGAGATVGYWHLMRVPMQEQVVGVSILLIRPDHRQQGLGQELVHSAALHLALKYRELWSRVFLRNARAIEFWAGLGFNGLAKHRGKFVQPPDETPSMVMVKKLHTAQRDDA